MTQDHPNADDDDDHRRSRFDILLRQHHAGLVRFLVRFTGNSDDAREIAQEAFLRIWITKIEIQQPKAFLYRVAVNVLNDHRRRDKARGRDQLVPFDETSHGYMEGNQQDALESMDALRQIVLTLETLPPRAREVFILARLGDFSYAEIATALRISVSAVEKHMMRALHGLDPKLRRRRSTRRT